MKQVVSLDPHAYKRHAIHGEGRIWAETNCYMDVWIELLHALGCEPIAALPCTLTIDFEGDQWTFFKFSLSDLNELYGLDVQELAIWRSLALHLEEQVARGRPVLIELDSYFLPDTAGSTYRRTHSKSTVAVIEIDASLNHLGYFHNQGYYHLAGEDFIEVLRLNGGGDSSLLPPYAEFVKIRTRTRRDASELMRMSLHLLRKHLLRLPSENPFPKFKQRFEQDLRWLVNEELESFHQYSFATLRQFGACFELAQTYLEWLTAGGQGGLGKSTRLFREISESAKAFQFQLARAVSHRKPLDLSPLDAMAEAWHRGTSELKVRYL